jgi:ribonuclease HI
VLRTYAYFDGAASGNPSPAGIGYAVLDARGKIVHEHFERVGIATNNEAEYRALIALAKKLLEEGIKQVAIMGDSQLVINQVNEAWQNTITFQ